jgi:hypothetical protein
MVQPKRRHAAAVQSAPFEWVSIRDFPSNRSGITSSKPSLKKVGPTQFQTAH